MQDERNTYRPKYENYIRKHCEPVMILKMAHPAEIYNKIKNMTFAILNKNVSCQF